MPSPAADCEHFHRNFTPVNNTLRFCKAIFDTFLCWPPTAAGQEVIQNCPNVHFSDSKNLAFRKCSKDGVWESRPDDDRAVVQTPPAKYIGWTNYSGCYSEAIQKLFKKLSKGGDSAAKLNIAKQTRVLEFVGCSLSLVALIVSLHIFRKFRTLRNTRTRIHKNLFTAMMVQVVVRLSLYTDQLLLNTVTGDADDSLANHHNIAISLSNTPHVCEVVYVLLEYAITCMFMWMLLEGIYLHMMIVHAAYGDNLRYAWFLVVGWVFPIFMTTVWAVVTVLYYGSTQPCWFGYNFSNYYWILEAPRLGVILVNLVFLLNIIRVLLMKMRQSRTSERVQLIKAVRAAMLLLPLLGITNILDMTEGPLEKSFWEFAIWSYMTKFLTSFQGFFIAVLYCFSNAEVREAIRKYREVQLAMRQPNSHPKNSHSVAAPDPTTMNQDTERYI